VQKCSKQTISPRKRKEQEQIAKEKCMLNSDKRIIDKIKVWSKGTTHTFPYMIDLASITLEEKLILAQ
jgi:hypothetical protein